MSDVQAAFTGAVEAGATEFLLPEAVAAEWRKLASVDVYTLPDSDSDAEAEPAGGAAQVRAPDGAPYATCWRVTNGPELAALQQRCASHAPSFALLV